MHVLEPKEIAKRKASKQKAKRHSSLRLLLLLIVVAIIGVGGLYINKQIQHSVTPLDAIVEKPNTNIKDETKIEAPTQKTKLKTFTGVQFRDLYRSINYPNTQPFTSPPEITGNIQADERIRNLANVKGFVLTSIPVAPIIKTGEKMLTGSEDDLLQPLALKSWQDIKKAGKEAGIKITLISAYRSPKWQRNLFTDRLFATGVTSEKIASGNSDSTVNSILSLTAVPGYSRHHTGYTVDMYCEDGVAFVNSVCNNWISKNNYENAKKYGWIPSYPPDGGEQGPEPEPWEFVWVGTDVLYE